MASALPQRDTRGMGFCTALSSRSAAPETASRDRSPSLQIASLPHERTAVEKQPTACAVRRDGDTLTFGDEIALHFEVTPRRVLYHARRDDKPRTRHLAVHRLEVRIADPKHREHAKGNALVIAAWPYSQGLVEACRFRTRCRESREALHERLAAKHEGDLLGLLREYDDLADDPFVTDKKERIAARFLLGEYDWTNADKKARIRRKASRAGRQPGWVLGLADYDADLAWLEAHHDELRRRVWGALPKGQLPRFMSKDPSRQDAIFAEVLPRALQFALAGPTEAPQSTSRRTPSKLVLDLAVTIGAQLFQVRTKSERE